MGIRSIDVFFDDDSQIWVEFGHCCLTDNKHSSALGSTIDDDWHEHATPDRKIEFYEFIKSGINLEIDKLRTLRANK